MKFKSCISTNENTQAAMKEVCEFMTDIKPDLLIMFVTNQHAENFQELLRGIHKELHPGALIGCTGESLIGPDCEVESTAALSIWAAELPGTKVTPFNMTPSEKFNSDEPQKCYERFDVEPKDQPSFILLPDPFSFDIDSCLKQMDKIYPDCIKTGGMASAGRQPGENTLFINEDMLDEGMVGIVISGDVKVSTMVSQGCRAIGEPFVVTKSEENIIEELGGKPAVEVLQNLLNGLSPSDQQLAMQGIHVGRIVDETRKEINRDSFLIRNLLGIAQGKGIAINELVKRGRTVQFHIRDAGTATEDMKLLLTDSVKALGDGSTGGLLFSCNGRGTHLFSVQNHDISLVNESIPSCQVAGFFAMGEIGPVGNQTFIHGFTSSLILFH